MPPTTRNATLTRRIQRVEDEQREAKASADATRRLLYLHMQGWQPPQEPIIGSREVRAASRRLLGR
jgi:hypothetical protein